MGEEEAKKYLENTVSVTREDIARAKSYVLRSSEVDTNTLAEQWLRGHSLTTQQKINGDSPNVQDLLATAAKAISLRLALYDAVLEMAAAGELFPAGEPTNWQPQMDYSWRQYHGGLSPNVRATFPSRIQRPRPANTLPRNPDIFLQGVDCKSLSPEILEAITQALDCFRRGLYMPATAMLAAGVEAAWTECGRTVASKLGNSALENLVADPRGVIGKKVLEIRKALEQPNAKPLLKAAGQTIGKVLDAETWTTVLRDRRNELHWTKSGNFIANHSETGILLMAAPLHLGTLEAIRLAAK